MSWLVEPTEGLWPPIEADAIRIISVDVDIDEVSPTRCRARWTVTVKLRDVAAFQQLAFDALPGGDTTTHAEIASSISTAWQWAAEPYAPLHSVPGITWTPVEVTVEHLPARAARTQQRPS